MNETSKVSRFTSGQRIASIFLSAALLATTFTGLGGVIASPSIEADAAGDYGLADNIQDGTILHCFDWKYNDIKAELQHIAEAGFTSIQTSPAQPDGTGSWYWLYQPKGFYVGNNGLGSKAELQALCSEADKYGIKVVVDVVANHLNGQTSSVQSDLQDNQYWHTYGGVSDWNDRYQVIYGEIGMRDLATENSYVQSKVKGYVEELKGIGVDGIRWDAAKHIGLPGEQGDFWPTVTSVSGMWNYGEILDSPGGSDPVGTMKKYTQYIGITDAGYGHTLRNAQRNGKVPTDYANWAAQGLSSDRIVYWGESHDTWANAKDWGYSWDMSQNQIDRCYAIVAARNLATSLYFSRPFSDPSAKENTHVGDKGSTHFTAKEVAEVNKFHNAMIGKKDYYSANGDGSACAITRQGGGAVIVKGSGSGGVSVANGGGYVPEGTYTDKISGNTFTVTSTTISGSVGDSGIAVIYDSVPVTNSAVVSATPDSSSFTSTVTVTMNVKNADNGSYTTSEGKSGTYTNGQTITLGSSASVGGSVTLTLTATGSDGKTATKTYTYTKTDPNAKVKAYFDANAYKWSSVYAYVYDESTGTVRQMAAWPGVKMTEKTSEGYYVLDVDDYKGTGQIVFTESSDATTNRYPAERQPGLKIGNSSMLFTTSNTWKAYTAPTPTPTPDPEVPTVTADKASGSSFTDETMTVNLTLANATKGTYKVDGGPEKSFTGSASVVIGEGKIGDSTVTVETTATSGSTTKNYTFTYNKKYVVKTTSSSAGSLASYYATNPTGVGKEKTITIDGDASDWSEDMLIAQGAAWDVANHWKGGHENCVLDTYALFAAWDDTNLYVGWQMVNTCDTWANPGDGPLSDGGRVLDVPLILALSVDPSSVSMTNKNSTGGSIWGKSLGLEFDTHVDRLFYMSGKPGLGEPSMFKAVDAQGNTNYKEGCVAFKDGGIEYKMATTNICSHIYGLNSSDSPSDVSSDSADWVDYKTTSHDTKYDSFYEIKIPLATLGIDKNYLTSNGIGAMLVATRGESALDCIPYDLSMVDNAKGDYASDPSTSHEKDDVDTITAALAKIGNGTINPTPTPTPTPTPDTTPLQVNFGTDKSAPQLTTTALTLKGIGMGGTAPYKYEFSVDGKVVKASNTTDTYTWKPGTSGKHTIKCVITDSTGATATVTKTFTAEGEDTPTPTPTELTNSSSVSSTSVTANTAVTLTGSASGGTSPYKYAYYYKKSTDSSWSKAAEESGSAYVSATSASFTPTASGTYNVKINVKDSAGTVASQEFNVTVSGGTTTTDLKNSSTISATSVDANTSVKVTGKASGGTSPYKYAFYYKKSSDSSWTVMGTAYGTATTGTFTAVSGTYTVKANVKDNTGKIVSKEFTVTVKSAALANNSTISATSVNAGTTVTMTGKATGGTSPYKYAYYYKKSTDSSWTKAYVTSSGSVYTKYDSMTFTPSAAGTYNVKINVKDKYGEGDVVSKEFTLTVKAGALANKSTISATSVNAGTTVTMTGKATGGTEPYKFAYYYKKSTASDWTRAYTTASGSAYTKNTSVTFKPTSAGTYNVKINVKDNNGTGTVVSKEFTLTVKSGAVANNSKISSTSISKNTTVTLTGAATGGTEPYKFAYYYKLSTASDWTRAYTTASGSAYTKNTTVTFTPSKAGTYNVKINVKDNNGEGTAVTKEFTLTVK